MRGRRVSSEAVNIPKMVKKSTVIPVPDWSRRQAAAGIILKTAVERLMVRPGGWLARSDDAAGQCQRG